jgi:hypothetical protein
VRYTAEVRSSSPSASTILLGLALAGCGGNIGGDPSGGAADAGSEITPNADASNCASVKVDLTEQIPTVMLLVDRSGSMTATFGASNRWDATYDTLMNGTTGVVKDLEGRVRFGVALYTSLNGSAGNTALEGNPAGTCPMMATVSPALQNHAAIDALYAPKDPQSDTPTGASIVATTAILNQVTLPGPKIIVLATDGVPDSCSIPNPANETEANATRLEATDAAQAAFAAGITTYVISVGDQVGASHLQDMANAGSGVPIGGATNATYYEALSPAQLITAFDDIINGVRSCVLSLDGSVGAGGEASGSVSIDNQVLQAGVDWRLNDPSTIEILGTACDGLLAGGEHSVSATFECGVLVN